MFLLRLRRLFRFSFIGCRTRHEISNQLFHELHYIGLRLRLLLSGGGRLRELRQNFIESLRKLIGGFGVDQFKGGFCH